MTGTLHPDNHCTHLPSCQDRADTALADIMLAVAKLQGASDLARYGFDLEEVAETLTGYAAEPQAQARRASATSNSSLGPVSG